MTEAARAEEATAASDGEFVTYPGSPFQLFRPYPPAGDQPLAIEGLIEGIRDGLAYQTLLGVTGSGKTFTMANVIAQHRPAGDRLRAQQDARRAALQRVPRVLPEERGRVLRQLLRLLPARGLRPAARPVHREGLGDQRAHRADAPLGDQERARAQGRDRGRFGERDLRHRRARGLHRDADDHARRRQARPARRDRAPDPDAVHAQRDRLLARHLPRPRRHDRRLPRRAQRARDPDRAVRRRARVADPVRPAHGPHPPEDPALRDLPGEPLRDAARADRRGDRDDQGRAARAPRRARPGRQARRGAAARAADPVRPRDAAGDRPLQGHRELHAPPLGRRTGPAAGDDGRLPAEGRADVPRREPRA